VNVFALIRAEFQKVLTTRIWWILLLVLVVYVAMLAGFLGAAFGGSFGSASEVPPVPTEQLSAVIYSVATAIGYVFPLMLGTLSVTGEFRHQTLTPTFLATPRRGRVLLAKIVALSVFGAIYGVGALIGSIGAGAGVFAITDLDNGLGDQDLWLLFARSVLAMALWAAIGVGVGALVPNQVAAIVIVLAFTQFVEPILRTVASFVSWAADLGNYLPGAAGDALVGASIYGSLGMAAGEATVVEWWQGGLILAAYAVVATVLGYLIAWRSDVT